VRASGRAGGQRSVSLARGRTKRAPPQAPYRRCLASQPCLRCSTGDAGLLVVLGVALMAFWLGAHALRRGPALAATSRASAWLGLAVALAAAGWSAIDGAVVTVAARRPGQVDAPTLAPAAAMWRPGAGARTG